MFTPTNFVIVVLIIALVWEGYKRADAEARLKELEDD